MNIGVKIIKGLLIFHIVIFLCYLINFSTFTYFIVNETIPNIMLLNEMYDSNSNQKT